MANGLIDMTEQGPCSGRDCRKTGTRAKGARDIEELTLRTKPLFTKTFFCQGCRVARLQHAR